jgi:cell division protein FtsL
MRALAIVLALLLAAAALSLVTAQHRSRGLFVDLERAQQQARTLEAEGDRLRIERGRLSQPAHVEAAARQLGLKPVDGKSVVFLPAQGAGAGATASNTEAGR